MKEKIINDASLLKSFKTRSELYAYAKQRKWTLFGGTFTYFKSSLKEIGIDYETTPKDEKEYKVWLINNRDEKIRQLLNLDNPEVFENYKIKYPAIKFWN